MIINPYKQGSRSAKAIKLALRDRGIKVWTLTRAPNNPNALVVNWGSSNFEYPTERLTVVNDPYETYNMSNKVKFFENTLHSTDTLGWTRNREVALEWAKAKSKDRDVWSTVVFARTKIEASGGKGIVIWDAETDAPEKLPLAPLYTKYVPKTHEYRLHFVRTLAGRGFTCMLAQRKVFVKKHPQDVPRDWKVRSHANGFVFQTNPDHTRIPAKVMDAGLRIMSDHFPRLHFAALDIMYHDKRDQAWVIEGNTAPGLENDTIRLYADYFHSLEHEHKQRSLR